MSWFDEFEKTAGESPAAETSVLPAISEEESDPDSSKRRTSRPWAVAASLVAVLAVAAGAVVGISNVLGAETNDEDVTAQPASTVTSTSARPTPTSSTSAAPVSPKCPDQPSPRPTTPEGAVVAFQQAYFAGDSEAVKEVLDPGSYLANVDWVTAAGDLIGSDICVAIAGHDDGEVDADTTVRTAEGEELLLMQKITTVQASGGWRVSVIEDRPVPQAT
ncbi:hypothetical protein CATRI_13500 (plasmid) [Corynebacterium atrinae]|uniref:hypothetical protein n=1 Tax=Corynebacterium atrinae TaxID=1336740 RepID=UPI0025B3723F|nr:hypothetical protein [Corynebacterium atrinae]WJY64744.1 hypothetical protein CATRI_13500 [Corynebacterium atrinae]